MSYQLKSNFASVITDFLAHKHALGYLYVSAESNLNRFDRFCYELFPKETVITKEIGLHWAERYPTEKEVGAQRCRITPVRELAKYINSIGGNAYVIPMKIIGHGQRYIPHIYTRNELSAFFQAVDHLPYYKYLPVRHLVFPVLFRLLYCCGLRPKEARILLTENVDLNTGVIKIIDSKGHKDRNVVLAPDVLDLCRKYKTLISAMRPLNKYFFPNKDSCYTGAGIVYVFNFVLKKAGLLNFKGRYRQYDFRHTFATHCLYRWMREGKDLNAYLPYLSAYMGHTRFSYTAYYIHLVPEFFPQMGQMNISKFESILPEVEK